MANKAKVLTKTKASTPNAVTGMRQLDGIDKIIQITIRCRAQLSRIIIYPAGAWNA